MRPDPLLVSGDWAELRHAARLREVAEELILPGDVATDRGHVSGLRHLAEQVRRGDVGEWIGLPGAGDGDGDHEDDGREADERGEDQDLGAHALLLSHCGDAQR